MGRFQLRPMRRTMLFSCILLVLGFCMVASAAFAFLAVVVHPAFLVFLFAAIAAAVGGGVWLWRALDRIDRAMAPIEETVLLNLEAISNYRPPAAPRRRDPRRWLRYMRHGKQQVKEGAR